MELFGVEAAVALDIRANDSLGRLDVFDPIHGRLGWQRTHDEVDVLICGLMAWVVFFFFLPAIN